MRSLQDALFREQIARSRELSPRDRRLEGPRLFDRGCALILDGLRHECPDATPEERASLSTERLTRLDRPGAMTSDEVVVRMIDALEGSGIPYIMVGSLASNFYGVPPSLRAAGLQSRDPAIARQPARDATISPVSVAGRAAVGSGGPRTWHFGPAHLAFGTAPLHHRTPPPTRDQLRGAPLEREKQILFATSHEHERRAIAARQRLPQLVGRTG